MNSIEFGGKSVSNKDRHDPIVPQLPKVAVFGSFLFCGSISRGCYKGLFEVAVCRFGGYELEARCVLSNFRPN